ncbi:MAG TPA: ABC transporter substrate-binding protein [Blastocatellia bacterium]|nr:ABC transporter substrate-binding protein [Blastocatellia bacterium]
MARLLLAAGLGVLSLLPLLSCRRGGKPGVLVIAIEQAPRGFDPRFSTANSQSAHVMQLVYDTLMVKDAHFDLVPSLAGSFVQAEDQKTFTFHIRSGVRFHNGRPLTSADVKYTFDSILDPATKSPIRGAIDKIAVIDTPDPLTVVFRMREPSYTFLGNLPAIGIIPNGSGSELTSSPMGSGPYRFVSYSEDGGLKLDSNAAYWGGAPNIPHIQVELIQDNSTRQAALMSGEVDLAYNAQFDPETIRALAGNRRLKVSISAGANIAYLGVNVTAGPLSNRNVRQAIAFSINRREIIHRLLRDQAREADSVLPPEQWAYDPGFVYNYDPEKAKQLLDGAGFPDPDGEGPQPRFSLSLMTSTNQLSRNIGAILQDQLRRVGIKLELASFESATFFDKLAKGQFELYYLIGVGGNQNTDIFEYTYHSRYHNDSFNEAIARLGTAKNEAEILTLSGRIATILGARDYCANPEVDSLAERAKTAEAADEKKSLYLKIAGLLTDPGGANRSRFCDPEVDRWIEDADRVIGRDQKQPLFSQIQKRLSLDLPQIYLWHPATVVVARSRVRDIQVEPSGSWYFITRLTLDDTRGK